MLRLDWPEHRRKENQFLYLTISLAAFKNNFIFEMNMMILVNRNTTLPEDTLSPTMNNLLIYQINFSI